MATVGQATLLVTKRFKQYNELCDLSKDKTAELSAGTDDLEGFWEVISFQVLLHLTDFCRLYLILKYHYQQQLKKVYV